MSVTLGHYLTLGAVLLAVGDRYEPQIAANKAADAKYR